MSFCAWCSQYKWGRLIRFQFVCTGCEDELFEFYQSKEQQWQEQN